jgi:putative FmdB family regulatory protein
MPVYTYRCDQCDTSYEKRKRFSDAHDTECSLCGSPVRRVINQVGIVFKGSGFYVTDNRGGQASRANGSAKPAAEGEKSAETSATTPAAEKSSSESAPAAPAGEKKGGEKSAEKAPSPA